MPVTTLIGDLIGSRVSADRRALHARFQQAIDDVNERFAPPTPARAASPSPARMTPPPP